MNRDFDIFKNEATWFIKQGDEIIFDNSTIKYSDDFKQTFPKLYELTSKARITSFTLTRNGKIRHYKLLAWGEGTSTCGWLCKFETEKIRGEIIGEHQLILDNIGGISATFHKLTYDNELLTNNQNFIFTKSECFRGIEDFEEYYTELCEEQECEELETDALLCFACESNGNGTFYDLRSKEVYIFATEQTFDNTEPLDDQPEFTFYTINDVVSFNDYVELIATQWIERFLSN